MDKPMTFNEWLGTQGNMALLHANCCRIAYEAGQQSQQAKVEKYQTNAELLNEALQRSVAREEELQNLYSQQGINMLKLQKRVDAAIKCADLNFWNANTVKAMVEALKGEGQ
ncbi:TPA: hypothetical protein ACJK7P_002043 [Acinetobacter baumannii]